MVSTVVGNDYILTKSDLAFAAGTNYLAVLGNVGSINMPIAYFNKRLPFVRGTK